MILQNLQYLHNDYDTNGKYKNRKLSKSKAESSEKALITDTYHELLACKSD